MVEASPRDTGTLANAWDLRRPAAIGEHTIEASTGNSQPHVLVIEGGAHLKVPPPTIAIQGWVQRKITNPVLVEAQKKEPSVKGKVKLYKEAKNKSEKLAHMISWAIYKRGLPSAQNSTHTGTFSRAFTKAKTTVDQIFQHATERISARFMGGSL